MNLFVILFATFSLLYIESLLVTNEQYIVVLLNVFEFPLILSDHLICTNGLGVFDSARGLKIDLIDNAMVVFGSLSQIQLTGPYLN